jgi:hypothetical protein
MNLLSKWVLLTSCAALVACGGGDSASTATASGGSDPAGCTTLTYTANTTATGNPHTNGAGLCIKATTSQLEFSGKTLTSPTQNMAVTAPYSAYAFIDGSFKYEVVFNGADLYEINVNSLNNSVFYGQFD